MSAEPTLVELLQGAVFAIHIARQGMPVITDSAFHWRQPFDERAYAIVQNAVTLPPDQDDLVELREYLLGAHEAALQRIGDRATMHLLFRDDAAPEDRFEVVWAFATGEDLAGFVQTA